MPSNPAQATAVRKAKRLAKTEQDYALEQELHSIEEKLHELMENAAAKLDIDVEEIRSQFLAYANVRSTFRPTAWNGLVHEKSVEWIDEKVNYPGGAYIQFVVEKIKDEGIYAALSEEQLEYYKKLAQKLRDDKLNAGSSKTDYKRLAQGTAKDDIQKIILQLGNISKVTSIQCVLLAVRGQSDDGLKPLYYTSSRARTFLENYLNVSMSQLLTMMETAVIGGASALANNRQTEGAKAKAEVRRVLLQQLRNAATSVAEDGSPPAITDSNKIAFVEWKNYHKIVKTYKVEVFGWPMVDPGRMVDPNSMGAGTVNHQLQLVKSSECGFRRLTDMEWNRWKETFDAEVEAGDANIATRKTRSDAGQKRTGNNNAVCSQANTRFAGVGQTVPASSEDGPVAQMGGTMTPPLSIDHQHEPPAPTTTVPHFLQPTFGIETPVPPFAFPAPPLQSPYAFTFSAASPSTSINPPSILMSPAHPASPGSYPRPLRFQNQTPETYVSGSPRRSRSRTPTNTLPRRTARRGATPQRSEFASPSA
ncbi:hypothetical protein FRC08_004674 [Ceratobasidium sp. 394]|nr:hypothetical protein FRC08_004674 [Ceratobasidium sp. 394]